MRVNYHIHTTGSDGKHSPEEMIQQAIKDGLTHICFTDHKRHNGEDWAKDFFQDSYVEKIKELKEEYKDKINISFGVEIDWFNYFEKDIKDWLGKYEFDFIMGSVHIVKFPNGKYIKVNYGLEELKNNFLEIGSEVIIKEYYLHLRNLLNAEICDGIGHFDLIKTLNKDNSLFNENSDLYKKEVLDTLDLVKQKKKCIEINTGGLTYDCKAMFPSLWILKEANKRGIPITVGTDAHWKERISEGIDEAYDLAKKAGYDSILIFKNRKPIEVEL